MPPDAPPAETRPRLLPAAPPAEKRGLNVAPQKPEWQRALVTLSGTVVAVTVLGIAYWARSIFIPLALGVFFAFVLSPVVYRIERRGLGRVPAVLGTVGLTLAAFLLVGGLVLYELSGLSKEIPEKSGKIVEKFRNARHAVLGDGAESKFGKMFEEISGALSGDEKTPSSEKKNNDPSTPAAAGGTEPVPAAPAAGPNAGQKLLNELKPTTPQKVEVVPAGPSWLSKIDVSPVGEVFGQIAFGFVLSVFMLIRREDLRNRLIRLIGSGRITTTTKAVDDASHRVSSYLLMQLIINSVYGVVITVLMLLVGTPFAVVWGVFGAVMRYVPYLGTWLALVPPAVVSLALSDGWTTPIETVLIFGVCELICNNVFEPRLYGKRLGVSEVAQMVAAAFWAFLWGPIGLVLSGPLTVCLVILGKYVRPLAFLEVVLGDEPALSSDVRFYQRLAARDLDEASAVVEEETAAGANHEQIFDRLMVPALTLARIDAAEHNLSADDEQYILKSLRELTDDLNGDDPLSGGAPPDEEKIRVLAISARDEADDVVLGMFAGLLNPERWEVKVATADTLASEQVRLIAEFRPGVVVVGSLPPGGLAHAKYLCKRARKRFPHIKLVVGRWGLTEDAEANKSQVAEAGADQMVSTLAEASHYLRGLQGVLTAAADEPAAKPAGRPRVGTAGAT